MKARSDSPFEGLDRSGLRNRMIMVVTAIVMLSVLALCAAALVAFNRAVEPELKNRTHLIGTMVRSEIQRALDHGIPFDSIVGLDHHLTDTLKNFDEVERMSVVNARGTPIAVVERSDEKPNTSLFGLAVIVTGHKQSFVLPIIQRNIMVGEITVVTNSHFVQKRLRDVFLDIGVLALIAIIVAVELSIAVVVSSVGKPLEGILTLLKEQRAGIFVHRIRAGGLGGLGRVAVRLNDHATDLASRLAGTPRQLRDGIDARISAGPPQLLRLSDFNDIRLALFMFSVGTGISAAFLPLYAAAVERPIWLKPELAAAAPLIMFLCAGSVVPPFGSRLIARFGARRLFLLSVPGASLALVALTQATTIIEVTIWLGVLGVFCATSTVAGRGYAIRAAPLEDKAKAVGAFTSVTYGGLFAGSALGGLIAGRFGFETAFAAGAILTALSVLFGYNAMRTRVGDRNDRAAEPEKQAPQATQASHATLRSWLTNRYLVLLLGVAIPMNMTMVVLIWYLTPLMLSAIGSGPAEIARVLVIYNLAIFLFGPTVARIADGRIGPMPLLILGALVSGVSVLSLLVWSGFWAITVAVAGVGIAQVLMQTPIYAMALRILGGPGPGIDILALFERLGAIAGLIASAVLLSTLGTETSLMILGGATLAGGVIYTTFEALCHIRRRQTIGASPREISC